MKAVSGVSTTSFGMHNILSEEIFSFPIASMGTDKIAKPDLGEGISPASTQVLVTEEAGVIYRSKFFVRGASLKLSGIKHIYI